MIKQEEMISVIVPIYNVEPYLRKCIDSVIEQTYKNLEIILVDDGSTDGCGAICDQYAQMDKRVTVIHQENAGLSAARNQGISMSKGRYISLIDSDDFVEKHYVEIMYKVAVKTDSDIVCNTAFPFYNGKEKKPEIYWANLNLEKIGYSTYKTEEMLELSLYQIISVTGAQLKLYKRKCFDSISFPENRYYEDVATTYQFFMNANHISVLDSSLYAYRIRKGSIMRKRFTERNLDCLWVSRKLIQDIATNMPFVKPAAYCAAFRICRLAFPLIPFQHDGKQRVWEAIKQYRNVVFKDRKAQKYERLLAGSSYGGPFIFTLVLALFKLACGIKNRTEYLRKK